MRAADGGHPDDESWWPLPPEAHQRHVCELMAIVPQEDQNNSSGQQHHAHNKHTRRDDAKLEAPVRKPAVQKHGAAHGEHKSEGAAKGHTVRHGRHRGRPLTSRRLRAPDDVCSGSLHLECRCLPSSSRWRLLALQLLQLLTASMDGLHSGLRFFRLTAAPSMQLEWLLRRSDTALRGAFSLIKCPAPATVDQWLSRRFVDLEILAPIPAAAASFGRTS